MSTLYIRQVSPVVLAKLDETAKQQKISRSELVRALLEAYTETKTELAADRKYRQLLQIVTEAIENNTAVLSDLKKELNPNA